MKNQRSHEEQIRKSRDTVRQVVSWGGESEGSVGLGNTARWKRPEEREDQGVLAPSKKKLQSQTALQNLIKKETLASTNSLDDR